MDAEWLNMQKRRNVFHNIILKNKLTYLVNEIKYGVDIYSLNLKLNELISPQHLIKHNYFHFQ